MFPGPVADKQITGPFARDFRQHRFHPPGVAEHHPQPAGGLAQAEKPARILVVHPGERAVEVVHSGVKDACHFKAAHARRDPRRCAPALRHLQQDIVALPHIQAPRQFATQHDPPRTGRKRLKRRIDGETAQSAEGRLVGFKAQQLNARNGIRRAQHALPIDIRRRRLDLRVHQGGGAQFTPFAQFTGGAVKAAVGQHAEYSLAHDLVETVHDRQHDHQQGHRGRDSQHREHRYQRNEAPAAVCPELRRRPSTIRTRARAYS